MILSLPGSELTQKVKAERYKKLLKIMLLNLKVSTRLPNSG